MEFFCSKCQKKVSCEIEDIYNVGIVLVKCLVCGSLKIMEVEGNGRKKTKSEQ
jgi:hypothetical protein